MATTTTPENLANGDEFIVHANVAGVPADTYLEVTRTFQHVTYGPRGGFVALDVKDRTGATFSVNIPERTLCYRYGA